MGPSSTKQHGKVMLNNTLYQPGSSISARRQVSRVRAPTAEGRLSTAAILRLTRLGNAVTNSGNCSTASSSLSSRSNCVQLRLCDIMPPHHVSS